MALSRIKKNPLEKQTITIDAHKNLSKNADVIDCPSLCRATTVITANFSLEEVRPQRHNCISQGL